jgi:hypothetical protein
MTRFLLASSFMKNASQSSPGISSCHGGYRRPRSSGIDRSHLAYAAIRGRPWASFDCVSITLMYRWKGLLRRSWALASSNHLRTPGVFGNTRCNSGSVKAANHKSVRAELSSMVRGSSLRKLGLVMLKMYGGSTLRVTLQDNGEVEMFFVVIQYLL